MSATRQGVQNDDGDDDDDDDDPYLSYFIRISENKVFGPKRQKRRMENTCCIAAVLLW
jgi:hypothetical protein